MAAALKRDSLIDRLPVVRGVYEENVPLAGLTWFRVGGPAEVVFRPADEDDLGTFLAGRPADVPITIIGVGSNLLVRDGGVPGVVIRLSRAFAKVGVSGTLVTAGASTPDVNVALAARDAGLAGLEFLRGVPGTIGGAVKMNAGAYGREMADVLTEAIALAPDGGCHVLTGFDLAFTYRHSALPEGWIITSATLRGTPDEPAAIARRMEDISDQRGATQPKSRTGGSTFKNPPGQKAWQLIDAAGCRGIRVGGAQMSELHCNFIINTGDATARDIEALGEDVRRRVLENSGVSLEWEIMRIGVPSGTPLQGGAS
ncbi:UDP-N-acetylmuramate dehydrogenase [Emcibacter sp. SYSU 3D8]|uniref:UDP-N-acetylmuramate dehydrogenase n=1 Tax=Emcibacter sp. SYSU 3D8 TaxID=3133969 RepID=UPI0031FEED9D